MLFACSINPDDSDFREWAEHFGPLIKQDGGTFEVPTDKLTAEWINIRKHESHIFEENNKCYDDTVLDAANFFNVQVIGNKPYQKFQRIYDVLAGGGYAKVMRVELPEFGPVGGQNSNVIHCTKPSVNSPGSSQIFEAGS